MEIVSGCGHESDFFELARAVILEKEILRHIISNKYVRIAIVIVVAAYNSHPPSGMISYTG